MIFGIVLTGIIQNFEFFLLQYCLSCMNLVKWLACLIGVAGNFFFFVLLMSILVDHVKEI